MDKTRYLIIKANTHNEWAEGPDYAIIEIGEDVIDGFWKRIEDAIFISESVSPPPAYVEWSDYRCTWVKEYYGEQWPELACYDFYHDLTENEHRMVIVEKLPECWRKAEEPNHELHVSTDTDRICIHTNYPTEVWWDTYLRYTDYPVNISTIEIDLRKVNDIHVFECKLLEDCGWEEDEEDAV
jgi:hypothetical protein